MKTEYISRDAAIETVKFYETECDPIPRAIDSLEQIPSADVAEVVHCRECVKWNGYTCISIYGMLNPLPNDYCARGMKLEVPDYGKTT